MKKLLVATALFLGLFSFGQDTITVQTFTYDSISTRRAIFNFPPELDDHQFEKVLMYYNLKCDPLTPWDGYNCGEWDYLTYSQIWNHTGVMDSNIVESPRYLLNNTSPSILSYVNAPYYNYYESYQTSISYTLDVDTDLQIGYGTDLISYPFGTNNAVQRTQILWTAAEISDALITAGDIAKLRFTVPSIGASMGHLTVKMKHTNLVELSGFDESGWTLVYDQNTSFSGSTLNTINLTQPFTYDGTSSILMEISFDNGVSLLTDNIVTASTTANNSVAFSNERLGLLTIEQGEWAEVDLTNYDFQDQLTISFWANGDMTYLPANTSIVEGFDSLNNRLINIHFPWSDERIYWDAGEGNGYDRIDKAALSSDYENVWHHWAFVKNKSTGSMKIYKDGVLWHSGVDKNRDAGIINKFRIGNSLSGNYNYAGKLDEFRIWNTELSQTEIADWMNKKLDPSHPHYNELVLYYDFDNNPSIVDKSGNGRDAMMTTPAMISFNSPSPVGYELSTIRPNIIFVQGNHDSQLDSIIIIDSVMVHPIDILEYQVEGRKFTIDTILHKFPKGYSYYYNTLGVAIDSVYHDADVTLTNETIFYYEEPFEIVEPFEIGRYITPYGIGFSLGPNGFTYVYDVTDYQSLLQGAVDFSAHNTQELIDIKFVYVIGTPPRNVLGVEQLWDGLGSYTYANLDNNVNLAAQTINLDPNGSMFKIRSRITGHGHNGSNNCCEWGNGQGRDHELLIDGTSRFMWDIWQELECADNPNISQGGTWPYAREGWCPGDRVEDHEFDITPYVTPGTSATIDYDIEDVPTGDPAQGNGNYVINMHMITYGAPNFSTDAAIVDVLNPNGWEYYSKWNPTCQNPRIILKNTGSNTLTSAEINIWIGEFDNVLTYTWTGNLEFLEETMVEIPITPQWWNDWEGMNTFTARVYKANGQFDEYENNNMYTVSFEPSPAINDPFFIWFKTNNKAIENDIFLRDQDGNIVYSRTDLANSTEYKDTMYLPTGCYTLEITDTDHDGISFWYSSQVEGETAGFLRLRKVGGSTIYTFDPDFGRYAKYSFSVGYAVGVEEQEKNYAVSIFPNPNSGLFNLSLDNFTGDHIKIEVYNELGALVFNDEILDNNPEGFWNKQINLSGISDGLYFVKIVSDDISHTERIIIN